MSYDTIGPGRIAAPRRAALLKDEQEAHDQGLARRPPRT